jgi:hypothetical protein
MEIGVVAMTAPSLAEEWASPAIGSPGTVEVITGRWCPEAENRWARSRC